MAKFLLITAALLAADSFDALQKAVADKPNDAAADLVTLSNELVWKDDAIDALRKINAELSEQIQSAPADEEAPAAKPTISEKTFTVDKTKYKFCFAALNLEGTVITNEDVLSDKDLQKKLVEMQSGFIEAV
jgi:hypothetical protein